MIEIREYCSDDLKRMELIHDDARKIELELAGLSEAFVPFAVASIDEDLFEYDIRVATKEAEVVGFIAYSSDEIGWLYVDPKHARQGIGRTLIQSVLDDIDKASIEVLSGNTNAIKLYESFGFNIIETVRGRMPGNEKFIIDVHVMKQYDLIEISQRPELIEKFAKWESEQWGIPQEAYLESMNESIQNINSMPRWYVLLNKADEIVGGAGVIENDYHERKDLSPNICALYIEEEYRGEGLAKYLLNSIRKDLYILGYSKVYLITDHTAFYEKCGWHYIGDIKDDEGEMTRMYEASCSE